MSSSRTVIDMLGERWMIMLIGVLLLPALASAEINSDPTPLVVVASPTSGGVAIAWSPGTQSADSYRIYGLADGVAHPLHETSGEMDGFAFLTTASYATYAVSGVTEGVETQLVIAQSPPPCIDIRPPHIYLNLECLPRIEGSREILDTPGLH